MSQIRALANGTIYPCRFVSAYPSSADANGFKVIEDIVVAQNILGVSQVGTTGFPMPSSNEMGVTPPSAAAIAGQELQVFADGEECLIELAGTVNAGDLLKANATTDGKAVAAALATSGQQCVGGIALQYGVSGEFIRMLVRPGVIYHA